MDSKVRPVNGQTPSPANVSHGMAHGSFSRTTLERQADDALIHENAAIPSEVEASQVPPAAEPLLVHPRVVQRQSGKDSGRQSGKDSGIIWFAAEPGQQTVASEAIGQEEGNLTAMLASVSVAMGGFLLYGESVEERRRAALAS